MSDFRPPVDAFTAAFGVPGVLTRLDSTSVDVTVIWHVARPTVGSFPMQGFGGVTAGPGVDLRRWFSIPKVELTGIDLAAEIGATVNAAEVLGGTTAEWRLDRVDALDPEFYECAVSR